MDIRIDIYLRSVVEDPASLRELEGRIMTQIADAIAHLSTTVDAAIGRVQADIAGLTGRVAALQAQVADGSATPEDLRTLAEIQAKLDALDPAKPDVLPPPAGATTADAMPGGAMP